MDRVSIETSKPMHEKWKLYTKYVFKRVLNWNFNTRYLKYKRPNGLKAENRHHWLSNASVMTYKPFLFTKHSVCSMHINVGISMFYYSNHKILI